MNARERFLAAGRWGHSMRPLPLVALLLAACARASVPAENKPQSPSTSASSTAPVHDAVLEAALQKIAAAFDAKVAVSVLHLGTGARASVHGDARMPLMSVFKLPLSVVALSMVEEGRYRLAQPIPISESELRPGVSPIAEAWQKGEHSPTLETLLVRVLQDSDNTAGDKLVSLEGGGAAITTRLQNMNLRGIDIAEQEIEIFARTHCPGVAPPSTGWTFPLIDACPKPSAAAQRAAVEHEIDASPNAATTDALVDLLAALDRGYALNSSSRAWLQQTMAGTNTGSGRLKAGLPSGTRIEHKTGTGDTLLGVNIATNDVGVITLPNGDRFAIAVLIAGAHHEVPQCESVIAAMAKVSWDRFLR